VTIFTCGYAPYYELLPLPDENTAEVDQKLIEEAGG
jgi:hypothetical protein